MKQDKADAFADNLTEAMNILISMNSGYNDIYGKVQDNWNGYN